MSLLAQAMLALASQQSGFLGFEPAREELGISASYWTDIAAIKAWKANSQHLLAQQRGKEQWYSDLCIRTAISPR